MAIETDEYQLAEEIANSASTEKLKKKWWKFFANKVLKKKANEDFAQEVKRIEELLKMFIKLQWISLHELLDIMDEDVMQEIKLESLMQESNGKIEGEMIKHRKLNEQIVATIDATNEMKV